MQVKLTFLVAKLGSCSKRHMICALFPLAADTSHSFSRGSSYKILSPKNHYQLNSRYEKNKSGIEKVPVCEIQKLQ